MPDSASLTPLHYAAIEGGGDVVRFLLCTNANPNARSNGGLTPLHCAAERGNEAAANVLLLYGADPLARESEGWQPLHCASFNGSIGVAKALIARGAKPHHKTTDGQTPVHLAALKQEINMVQFLQDMSTSWSVTVHQKFGAMAIANIKTVLIAATVATSHIGSIFCLPRLPQEIWFEIFSFYERADFTRGCGVGCDCEGCIDCSTAPVCAMGCRCGTCSDCPPP